MAKKLSWLMMALFILSSVSAVIAGCALHFSYIADNRHFNTYTELVNSLTEQGTFDLSKKEIYAVSGAVADYWSGEADTPQVSLQRGEASVSAFSEEELEALAQLKNGLKTCSPYRLWYAVSVLILLLIIPVEMYRRRYMRKAYPEEQACQKAAARFEKEENRLYLIFCFPAMILFCVFFLLWWRLDSMSLARAWLTAFSPAFLTLPEDGLLRALINEDALLQAGNDVIDAVRDRAIIFAGLYMGCLVRWFRNRGKTPETNETALEEGNA